MCNAVEKRRHRPYACMQNRWVSWVDIAMTTYGTEWKHAAASVSHTNTQRKHKACARFQAHCFPLELVFFFKLGFFLALSACYPRNSPPPVGATLNARR